MTATPRSSTQQHTQPDTRHIRQFLAKLYADQAGYIEVGYINGDPRTEPVKRARWVWHTPERRATIANWLAQLAQRYGNVYISSTLYHTKLRSAAAAQPSRVVFIDDAPERHDYSMVVRTSDGSRHAYYLLEQPVDASTRAELQRRAAYAFGADKSGWDVTQLVRIPGSINTKHGGRYPVHTEHSSNRTYSVEQLRRRWPEVAHLDSTPAAIDWQAAERWLGNINQLLGADGIPRRLTAKSQARRVLTGEISPPSTSEARAFVCLGLVLHGYPDDEIAALLIHLCDYGASQRKGSSWLYQDIARLIAKERAKYPNIEIRPSGVYLAKPAQALPTIQRTSRARKDRPQKINADGLLAWYTRRIDAGGMVFMTRTEAAKALKISIPTLDRLERQLRERGQLERRTSKDRRRSWVAILGAINIPQQPAKKAPDSVLSANAETAHNHAEKSTSETCIKEHTPLIVPPVAAQPEAQPAPQPRLVDAIRAMRLAGARTRKQLHRMIGEYFPGHHWTPSAIDRCYDAEREDEKRRRLMDRIASMTRKELRKAIRSAEYRIAKSHAQETAEYKFWLVYRDRCERQLQRTIAADNQRRRTREQQLPLPPALSEPEPQLVDNPMGFQHPHAAPSGGVCFTQRPSRLEPSYIAGVRIMALHGNQAVLDYLNAKHIPLAQHGAYIAAAVQPRHGS